MEDTLTKLAISYGFILIRVLAIVFVMPLWRGSFPGIWKVLAAVWMCVLFSFIVPPTVMPEKITMRLLILGGAMEFMVGAIMGFLVQVFLGAIILAGQLAGVQMGLGVAQLLDPTTSENRSAVSQWFNLLAMCLFIQMDGHLLTVRIVARSFEWIPPFSANLFNFSFYNLVIDSGEALFRLGLHIAWPFSLLLLSVYLCLGLLARMAPQINMLMSGFPITVSTGLFILMKSVYSMNLRIERILKDAYYLVEQVLLAMRG